jgi:hypothetical protein
MYSKCSKNGNYQPKSLTWFMGQIGKPLVKSSNKGISWTAVDYKNTYEAHLCHDMQDMNHIQFETIND